MRAKNQEPREKVAVAVAVAGQKGWDKLGRV